MYKTILMATDGSALAAKGIEQGLELSVVLKSNAIIMTATEPWEPGMSGWGGSSTLITEYQNRAKNVATELLATWQQRAEELKVPCQTIHMTDRFPADAILQVAKENEVELIVMASHGRRGLGRVLMGSQANSVVTRSNIPVLIVR